MIYISFNIMLLLSNMLVHSKMIGCPIAYYRGCVSIIRNNYIGLAVLRYIRKEQKPENRYIQIEDRRSHLARPTSPPPSLRAPVSRLGSLCVSFAPIYTVTIFHHAYTTAVCVAAALQR